MFFLLAAYDGSSASSCIRFCSAACGGDDRLPEFPIHPTDPQETFVISVALRQVSKLTGRSFANFGL